MLKTDYKDDVLDLAQNTKRKFRLENNADGTVSFSDETVYSQVGDNYGSADVNETNSTVNGINSVVLKTLTVAGWQLNGSVYEQTISFTKIHSLKPIITACGATLGTLATDEQYAALGGLKVTGDTDANTMTFYAATAPTVEINISVWGVE